MSLVYLVVEVIFIELQEFSFDVVVWSVEYREGII